MPDSRAAFSSSGAIEPLFRPAAFIRPIVGSHLPDEIPDAHVERVRNQLQCSQRHALLAAFQPVQVDAIQPSQIRQLILRDALRQPRRPDTLATTISISCKQ